MPLSSFSPNLNLQGVNMYKNKKHYIQINEPLYM